MSKHISWIYGNSLVFLLPRKIIFNILVLQTPTSAAQSYLVWFSVAICSMLDLFGTEGKKGHETGTEERNYRQITLGFIHHSLLSCQELFQLTYNMHMTFISRRYKNSYDTYLSTYRNKSELYTKAYVTGNCTDTLKKEGSWFPKGHVMNIQCISRK